VSCLTNISVISFDQTPSRWYYLLTICCRQSLWQVESRTSHTIIYPLITKPLKNKHTANYDTYMKCTGKNSSVQMKCHIWKHGLDSYKDLKVIYPIPPKPHKCDYCTDCDFTEKRPSLCLLSKTKIIFKLGGGVL